MEASDTPGDLVCANWNENNSICVKAGKFSCKNCLLVLYCGPQCQKSHWNTHKLQCKTPLLKDTWRPRWEIEQRSPAFMGGPPLQPFNERKKHIWGNMPAYDVLQLGKNEGEEYRGALDLLFAASGDLRNAIVTLASIPSSFCQPVKLVLNDKDFDIVARNVIMLLLILTEEDPSTAAEGLIHLWYSAFITPSLIIMMQEAVRPLIQTVCSKVEKKAPETVLGKTWKFDSRSLRLVLTRDQWFSLLSYFEVPAGLTLERAKRNRLDITLAPQRVDYRDRRSFAQRPGWRVGAQKYREDGILLPFGAPRASFSHLNPTIFRTLDSWPLKDNADPTDGWPIIEVQKVSTGAATNDMYGKLYLYLKGIFVQFHRRISTLNISFQLHNVDAEKLEETLGAQKFDRIEVANISDRGYLGPAMTVCLMGRLLKPPVVNPHATLVTLFMNAVTEMITDQDELMTVERDIKEVWKYMPPSPPLYGSYDAGMIVRDAARTLVRDNDKYFDRYVKELRFDEFVHFMGMEMKRMHTIIDKWPWKIKKRPDKRGAKEEFETLSGSAQSGWERYVEWRIKS